MKAERQYDSAALWAEYEELFKLIQTNDEQLDVWNAVQEALNGGGYNVIYTDGPAATGKTTLYRALLAEQRALGRVALPHAFSGIAAQQLLGGKTIHSRFRLPVPLPLEDASCNLSLASEAGELLRIASLIIWDEGPNAPLAAFDAVDYMSFHEDLYSFLSVFASEM